MIRRSLLAAALFAISGAAEASDLKIPYEIEQIYAAASVSLPTDKQMMVCYGFACRLRTFLDFSNADRGALTGILAKGRASPDAERKAIQQAVVWFDRRIAPTIGTAVRVARADFRNRDDDHNFDCTDTTRNITGLLLVMQQWNLLHHHAVEVPKFRGNFLLGQPPHNTPVLKERVSGAKWVVDMWPTAYARVPDVMTLERWMSLD